MARQSGEGSTSKVALVGTLLGDYLVERELGSGGMGRVFAARVQGRVRGLKIDSQVALKVLHPHLLEAPGAFKRFLREAGIGKSVEHANVVRTIELDAAMVGGQQLNFLVMEYVEGQTLRALARELDPVPEELCLHIAREICRGLDAIHRAGAVHRDLKPDNVLITADHVVKVMDLGIARLADEAMRMSQTGVFVGSVEYGAPEQFQGGAIDERTDLHALGVLLYEIASSTHPYRSGNYREIMRRVCETEPRRLGELQPQLTPFFEEVVHSLLEKVPQRRFASAVKLLEVLDQGERSQWWSERVQAIRSVTMRPLRHVKVPRDTHVFGRDQELAQLSMLLERVRLGAGQVVLIEGEAGIGKTRLVDEFVSRAHKSTEAINFMFGSYPPGGVSSATSALCTAYFDQFGGDGARRYLRQAPALIEAFDAHLRGETPPTGAEPLNRDSIMTCFVHATRNLASEHPTILLIDDLHFASEEGRAIFTSLALAIPGHRVLLIGTARPGVDADWLASLARLPHLTRMPLARLGPKDLAELLADAFHSRQLAIDLAGQIGVKSDGNPFFVFEILRGLREGQFIARREDGTWFSSKIIEEIRIPSSVLDLVNVRVAELSPEDRDLLDVASCCGYEFNPLLVGEVLGLDRIPVLRRIGQIERQHRLVRAVGRSYVFDHHQVQEALYGSLSELLREEYHSALAEALERRDTSPSTPIETLDGALCVSICEHHLRGTRGEKSLRYLDRALSHLENGYQNAQAIAICERVLGAPGLISGLDEARLCLRLASRFELIGRRDRHEQSAMRALEVARAGGDRAIEARALAHVGRVQRASGRYDDALQTLELQRDLAIALGDRNLEGKAYEVMGAVLTRHGRLDAAREKIELSRAIYEETADPSGIASACGHLGIVHFHQGRPQDARESFEFQLKNARACRDRKSEAAALTNLGVVLLHEGRFDEAFTYYEQNLAISREIGNRRAETIALSNLSINYFDRGLIAESIEHSERSAALARETGNLEDEAVALVNLALTLTRVGGLEEATATATRCRELCAQIGTPRVDGYAIEVLAEVATLDSSLDEAERLHREVLNLRRRIGYRKGVAVSLSRVGAILVRGGRHEEAAPLLREAIEISRELGQPLAEVLASCWLAQAPGGDVAAAQMIFEQSRQRIAIDVRMEVSFMLWQLTGLPLLLETAHRLMCQLIAHAPPARRSAMSKRVPIHNAIASAWAARPTTNHGELQASWT